MDGEFHVGDEPATDAAGGGTSFTNRHASISIIPHFTGLLSVLGSLFILLDILHPRNRPKKLRAVYHRLLLGMSVSDLCSSVAMALSTWPIPKGTSVYAASGTQGTCTAQGFFVQMGTAAPLYNGFLAVYYLLTVRYNWSRTHGRMITWERRFHVFAWILTVGMAFAAMGLEQYNSANLWCWIAPLPNDCVNSSKSPDGSTTCTRGNNAYIYRIAFYFIWLWTSLIVVTFAMCLVVHTVWAKAQASRKYDARAELRRNIAQRLRDSVKATAATMRHSRKSAQEKNISRVATQASLYVGAFFLTAIFPSIVRMFQAKWNCTSEFYPLSILTVTFYPLQGFWNFFIYVRPRYLKYRKDHPRRGSIYSALADLWQRATKVEHSVDSPSCVPNNKMNNTELSRQGRNVAETGIISPVADGASAEFSDSERSIRIDASRIEDGSDHENVNNVQTSQNNANVETTQGC